MLYIFLFLPLGSIMAQAANSIQWINPSAGASFTSGQAVKATWTSDRPIQNPTFSWCTPDGQCGPPSQPQLVDNDDGTTSANLMPPDSESAKGMFLQMSDKDGGGIHQSPSFTFTASDEATPLLPPAGKDAQAEATNNPYQWSDSPTAALTGEERPTAYPTPMDGMYPNPSAAMSMSMAAYGLPTAYPGQQPFANPYAVLNMSTTPLTSAPEENQKQESNRPNAAIVAVPLSICGVILLASLMFCARSRYTRKAKTDLENATAGIAPGPPTDWQAIVKRKAMDASAEKGEGGGGGVTITERRADAILPTLGYDHAQSRGIDRPRHPSRDPRYDDPPRYQRESRYSRDGGSFADRRREREMRDDDARSRSSISSRSATRCITPLPAREHSYHDRYTAAPMVERRRCDDYKSRSRYGNGSKHWDEYDDRHSIKDDYYATTRRSRSGLDGIDDRERCDCPPRLHSHSLLSAHNSRSRDCSDCHRSIPATRHSHSHIRSHHQSRSSSIDPFADMPGPTYEPMIRTQTSSTASMGMSTSTKYRDDIIVSKKQNKMHRAQSSASTITEAEWDLAGKGAYETGHDRGMGELYESLRRAIGESEIVKPK